jgi:putative transposase
MGNLLVVKVHAANIHDTMGGCHVYQAAKNKYFSIKGACVDAGYRGTFVDFVKTKYGDMVDVSEQIKPKQWQILPKRWRVERTFAWANWSRILSKDYEIKAIYQENSFMVSHLLTLLRRYCIQILIFLAFSNTIVREP